MWIVIVISALCLVAGLAFGVVVTSAESRANRMERRGEGYSGVVRRACSGCQHARYCRRPCGMESSEPIRAWPHQSQRAKLNVYFVEWLMGIPFGWTGVGSVAMAWFQSWQRSHSSILRHALERALEMETE